MKKLLAFDLDGTLAPSKSPLPDQMTELFVGLLKHFQVCVISGAKYELMQSQILAGLPPEADLLKNLHLMPTSGTRYYTYDAENADWKMNYADDFTPAEKKSIIDALEKGLDESGYRQKKTYGETIEDRNSQITLSILGQDIVSELGLEGVRIKEEWDPDGTKKLRLRDMIAPHIPQFEVRAAGATSIDITKPGIDKAYGMRKLMEATGLKKDDILFMGDKIIEGGNDYPVKIMGIDCIEVDKWEDTALVLRGILHII